MSEKMQQFTIDSDKVLKATVEALLAQPEWTTGLLVFSDDTEIDYSSITREVSA